MNKQLVDATTSHSSLTPTATNGTYQPSSRSGNDLRVFEARGTGKVTVKILEMLYQVTPALAVQLCTYLFLRPRRRLIHRTSDYLRQGDLIHVDYDNVQLVGYRWGKTEARKILVVHGWESHLGRMIPLIRPLVAAGYQVVAFDAPGHGRSPKTLTNLCAYGDAILGAIQQHGPFYGIVANSFGAAATTLMLERRQDVHLQKLIMLAPMAHLYRQVEIFEHIVHLPARLHTRLLVQIGRRIPQPLDDCDVAKAVRSLKLPGLIIQDTDDKLFPIDDAMAIAESYPNSTFMQTQGLGHAGVKRSGNVHRRILDFLAE